ncbi:MAG: hypothetical protein ACREB0_11755, partial [Sphingopyxis sp.]
MFVAIMPIMTSPFIVGSAMDAIGITMAKAGWLGASALVPIALTSMASAPFLPRLPIRAFAVFCAAMLGFSYLGLAAVDAYWQYVCLSIFGGVGAGGLLAVIAMKVAQTPDPERVYGYIYTVTSIGFAALMFGLLPMREFAGVGAMFLVLAGLAAAPIPLLARLATSAPAAAAQSHEAASAERWPVILLFAVMTLAAPLNGGVYAFCERKAAELSLSAQATGTILSLTMICSIIGSVLVSW